MIPHLSERGLILAPIGRDAQIAAGMLAEAGVGTLICRSVADLVQEMSVGAGFAIVTEEALRGADLHGLAAWIEAQPEWSDFPFMLLTQRGGGLERNPAAARFLETLGNVSFLERPFHPTTLLSIARAALRGRRRQYEARSRLESLRLLNETLEARITEAVAERKVMADIVESTDAFVQVMDQNYRFIAVNAASASEFERIFGVRPRVGDCVLDLLEDQPEQSASVKAVWSRALAGEEFTDIGEFGQRDGAHGFYEMKFNTLRDREGHPIGAYQFVHDVTRRLEDERKLQQARDALRQAQKMEAVGQLTGGVAHDFNNLLMVISGGMKMLERQLPPDRRQRVVDGMKQAVERGAALTRQLLAFSRRRPLEQKPLDLGRQLEGMRELLGRSLGGHVRIDIAIAPDLGVVEIDAGEFELAILNLCVNARDAMPAGGVITIAARNARNKVVLTVADTGSGIPKDILARVFEPFFTTKEVGKGSGLGLAQVYAFVSQSGGDVAIDSEEGQGALITLAFPRSAKVAEEDAPHAAGSLAGSSAAPEARHESPNGAPGGARLRHVLLVEDDKEVAAMTAEMLDSIGYAVTHVFSPAAALGALANGREIDIVFSDVMMPGGMNGVELAHEIRRRRPDLPVILATGYVEGARAAMSEGVEVLAKPYQIDVLAHALRDHLAAHRV